MLLTLALVKIVATALCFGSGTPGGLFAPTLFAGAMIGGGIGAFASQHWVAAQSHMTAAAVLVGMGTFFASVFRAPMTSIFMVFEVSASYQIILPVMIANTVGYLVARQWSRVHFFDELAREEGINLPSVQEQREIPSFRVEDAMSRADLVFEPSTRARDALAALDVTDQACLLVRLLPRGFAVVHRPDFGPSPPTRNEIPLEDILELVAVPTLYPDLSLETALGLFGQHPGLPVVRRDAPDTVVGLLTMEDVSRAFRIERWTQMRTERLPETSPAEPLS
jgi:CIC family chloride channel protein